MRSGFLAVIAAAVGLLFSLGAFAAPPLACSNYATVAAWAAAGSCVDDADSDLLLTYVSSTGLFPASAGFNVAEVELAGTDLYMVSFDFSVSGWSGGGGIQYRLTSLNQERIASASLDTLVQGTGAVATKTLTDIGSATPFLTLTSINGSRDPASGETSFTPRASLLVSENFNQPGTAVFFHADNTAAAVAGTTQEVPVDSRWALALLVLSLALAGAHRLGVRNR